MEEHDPLGAVPVSYEMINTALPPHTYEENSIDTIYDVKPFSFDDINQNTGVIVKEEPMQRLEPVVKIVEKENDISLPKQSKKRKKKIPDDPNALPYYCCSVCDERYSTIQQLQRHVVVHKGRVTSWDLRVQSKKMRKKMKKEKKRLKKIKQEEAAQQEIKSESIPKASCSSNSSSQFDGSEAASLNTVNGELNSDNTVQIRIIGNKKKVMKSVGTDTSEIKTIIDGIMEEARQMNEEPKTFCDKETQTSLNLERIFKCGLCHKQFNLGYYLKLHVRSHTGEKPYQCAQCGECFITASKLGRHRQRAHLAARAECRVCHRRYPRLEHLVRHFDRHHADEKIDGEPYDYNAILPYLKELEEELQRKREKEIISQVRETIDQFKCDPRFDLGSEAAEVKEEVKEEIPEHVIKIELAVGDGYGSDGAAGVDGGGGGGGGADVGAEGAADGDDGDSDYLPDAPWLPPPLSPDIVVDLLPEVNGVNKVNGVKRRPRRTRTNKDAEDSEDGGADPLKCDTCGKRVSSLSYMRIHMRTHTGYRPYKCHICEKSFITASKINRHLLTHVADGEDGASEVIDPKAGADGVVSDVKPRRKRRRRNVQVPAAAAAPPTPPASPGAAPRPGAPRPGAPAPRRHRCQYCSKRFAYEEALQLHMTTHNGVAATHTCEYCLAQLPTAAALAEHAAEHAPPRPYLCTRCGRTYKKRASMIYHRRSHSADPAPLLPCPECPRAFRTRHALARHAPAHAPRAPARYPCPVCAHHFRTRYHAAAHLASHAREGLIMEEHRGQLLAMIMQNVTREEPAPAQTAQATQATQATQDTQATQATQPGGERSRVCNICGEVFPHFFYLEQHLKTHATQMLDDDDPALKKHICPVCSKGFKLSYYLKLHSFTHTKERPYICQQCGKGFITKGKLRRHMETHAGVKKYQCHVCCKFFTRPSYLRIHVRTIHGTQDYSFKPDLTEYGDVAESL